MVDELWMQKIKFVYDFINKNEKENERKILYILKK